MWKYLYSVIIALGFITEGISQLPVSAYIEEYGSNLIRPTEITHAGDERLFVCDKFGKIFIVTPDGTRKDFLRIEEANLSNEGGLLGLAFHPNYDQNGYFYVYYTDDDRIDKIARYSVSNNNPQVADPDSRKIILRFPTPIDVHHGGCLRFGPDGYLYISRGDAAIPEQAQNGNSYLGKILRIDVDQGEPYGIPADNPYVGNDQFLDEIWAMGLRNPWKFSFDRLTGDMWVTDVGTNLWEEINLIPVGTSGQNFGWPCLEGSFEVDLSYRDSLEYPLDCSNPSDFVAPIAGYAHTNTDLIYCTGSITGGFVYRGLTEKFSDIGAYVFSDYCTGQLLAVVKNNNEYEIIEFPLYTDLINGISTFGEGHNGELFFADYEPDKIYSLDFSCKHPDISTKYVASCDSFPDGCIEIDIPLNEDINSVVVIDSSGQTIPESEYCRLYSGDYSIRTSSDDDVCNRDIPFTMDKVVPAFYDLAFTMLCTDNDGCVRIEIEQEAREYINVSLESSDGEVIDTADYCRLFPDNYTCIIQAENNSSSCRSEFPLRIPFFNSRFEIELMDGILTAPDSFLLYQWYYQKPLGELELVAVTEENTYVPQEIGSYGCYAYNEEGCEYRSRFIGVFELTSIQILKEFDFKIYPNPTDNFLTIEAEGLTSSHVDLSLTSITGETLLKQKEPVMDGRVKHNLTVSNIDPGVYFLKVMDHKNSTLIKLIIN